MRRPASGASPRAQLGSCLPGQVLRLPGPPAHRFLRMQTRFLLGHTQPSPRPASPAPPHRAESGPGTPSCQCVLGQGSPRSQLARPPRSHPTAHTLRSWCREAGGRCEAHSRQPGTPPLPESTSPAAVGGPPCALSVGPSSCQTHEAPALGAASAHGAVGRQCPPTPAAGRTGLSCSRGVWRGAMALCAPASPRDRAGGQGAEGREQDPAPRRRWRSPRLF